jgi:hypothetical protein
LQKEKRKTISRQIQKTLHGVQSPQTKFAGQSRIIENFSFKSVLINRKSSTPAEQKAISNQGAQQ